MAASCIIEPAKPGLYTLTSLQTLNVDSLCRILNAFKRRQVSIRKIALQPNYFHLEFSVPSDEEAFSTELQTLWQTL